MCEDRLRGADSDSLLASHVRRRAGLLSGGDGERIVFPNSCFSRLASRPCAVPSGRRAFSISSEYNFIIFVWDALLHRTDFPGACRLVFYHAFRLVSDRKSKCPAPVVAV